MQKTHLGPYELNSIVTGDAFEALHQLPNACIDLYITSPPYNCRKDYGQATDGASISDEMPWPDYYTWMGKILDELYRTLVVGGTIAINVPDVVRWQAEHRYNDSWSDYDPTYLTHRLGKREQGRGRIEPIGFTLFEIMRQRDSHMREPIIWVKGSQEWEAISTNHQMGSDNNPYMRPCHEMILLGSKGQWFHRGGTGRRGEEAVPFLEETKTVWFMRGESNRKHPAVFPQELPTRLIRLFTHAPDSIVADPFTGMGTTALAAKSLGRAYFGIERNPLYAELARQQLAHTQLELSLP